jgi:uncharacterized protein YjbI with pentapeptide repeats
VLFSDTNFSFSNFEHTKLQKILLTDSNFSSACLAECFLKEIELKNMNLNTCDFFKTSLKGIDFRDSRIEGIQISDTFKELQGVIVDTYQAAELARFLGVLIR